MIDEELARILATDYSQYEKMVAPLYERKEENTHEQKRPRTEQTEKARSAR
jgi:hypothetical protein